MSVINIQTMHYINLLDTASRVKTRKCYAYNGMIIFAVPRQFLSQAIGPNASNIKFMNDKLGKRIRIIEEATGLTDAQRFVADIVSPVGFKSLEIKDGVFVLTAGMQSKAALLGRNKRRYEELRQILKDTFNLELKIV